MKSFKQKQEERQRIIDAERLIAEEKAFKIQQQKESNRIEQERLDEIAHNKALLEEQQRQEDNIWENRQAEKLLEQQEVEYQKSLELDNQIDSYRTSKEKELETRSSQKDTIKEILSGEDQIRETISLTERQLEMDEYEKQQLQKIEEAEKLLEQQLAEERAKQKQERLDEIAEQEKLAQWKENEKIEQEENQRMKELREAQEQEKKAKEAIELQEIISSREIYELRQQEIAKQQKEKREAVNKILQEAQHVLDSEKNTREKQMLSNLRDYIYRLNPNQEKDIWTERVQPKSILTWEEWKQVPANNVLVEQNFRRARLLFEQDNQRAERYHAHVYQNFAGRYLTLDRKKALAADGKLVDISYDKLVTTRKDIMKDIGNIQFWLDAADRDTVETVVTSSLGSNVSVSAFWVPDDQINVNDSHLNDIESYYSSSLIVENTANLFDGDPETFMTVRHTSASYDWHQRNIDAGGKHLSSGFLSGIYYLRVQVSDDYYDKRIDRLELRSTDRKFIPEYITTYARRDANNRWERLSNFNITSSFHGNGYHQLSSGGEQSGSQTGGAHGITPEGSASLDPFYGFGLFPAFYKNTLTYDPDGLTYDAGYYQNDFLYRVNVAATGSECRFHGLDVLYYSSDDTGSAVHGKGVHKWKSQPEPSVEVSASTWCRTKGGTYSWSSRLAPFSPPNWYSASDNQPAGFNMPYVQFSSCSFGALSTYDEFFDYTDSKGFTTFMVARDTAGTVNQTNVWWGDSGQTYKTAFKFGVSGFYRGGYVVLTDWENGGDLTSPNQQHAINVLGTVTDGEYDVYGNEKNFYTGSAWPSVGPYHPNFNNQLGNALGGRETAVYNLQLDNPMTEVSSSRFRFWHKGGTPFVDVDAGPITDYSQTGSHFAEPQLGASRADAWADFRLHEMIQFKKVLTTAEIDQVNEYLTDKWKLNTLPVKSDVNGDFIYALSSSNSSMNQFLYDGTNVTSSADNVYSSSGWELS